MKKIRAAYNSGIEGKPRPENSTRAQRLVHRLGQKSVARNVAVNSEIDKQNQDRLHEAVSLSVGINKRALELIELATEIPNQTSTNPGWGYEWVDADGKHSREWVMALSHGPDQDTSRPMKTPLVDSLGSLHVDRTDWAHNGFLLPVDNVFIVCTAPMDTDGNMQAAFTRIDFNTRPYNPYNLVLDYEAEPRAGVKVTLSPDGHITEFGMERSGANGYVEEDPSRVQVDLGSFFDNANRVVAETVSTYQSIPDGPSQ